MHYVGRSTSVNDFCSLSNDFGPPVFVPFAFLRCLQVFQNDRVECTDPGSLAAIKAKGKFLICNMPHMFTLSPDPSDLTV